MSKSNFLPKDIEDLQVFAEAQFKTILDLNKTIQKLEKENEALKQITTIPKQEIVSTSIDLTELMIPDEKFICEKEIRKLRDIAILGALTYEEAKKLQIYVELLLKIENKPRTIEITRKMEDSALLAVLENDDSGK